MTSRPSFDAEYAFTEDVSEAANIAVRMRNTHGKSIACLKTCTADRSAVQSVCGLSVRLMPSHVLRAPLQCVPGPGRRERRHGLMASCSPRSKLGAPAWAGVLQDRLSPCHFDVQPKTTMSRTAQMVENSRS